MRGLDHFDAPRRQAVAVARDDQAREPFGIAAPVLLDRARHGGGRLAGTDHHGAPGGGPRQEGGQAMRRIGRADRRIEESAQQGPLCRETHRHGCIQPKLSSL
jgi:hypothetical protein